MKIISFFEKHLSEIVLVMVTVLIIIGFFICWSPALSWWGKSLMVLGVALSECVTVYILTRQVLATYRNENAVCSDKFTPLMCTHTVCCLVLMIALSFIAAELAWIIPIIVMMIIAFFAGVVLIGVASETVFGRY